jgi:cell division protein FtsQ
VILVVENNKTPNVKKEDIYKIINESLNGTALNTDLEQISFRILNNLWVSDVVVRRIWPNKMLVRVKENKVVAVFNKQTFLTEDGNLIRIPLSEKSKIESNGDCRLLELEGPMTAIPLMMKHAQLFGNSLSEIGLNLKTLRLTEQYSWEVETVSNLLLRFGVNYSDSPISLRLKNFVRVYPKLKENFTNNLPSNDRIKHVDLRYAQGFAVKTASKNKSVTYSKLKDSCLLNNKHRGLK